MAGFVIVTTIVVVEGHPFTCPLFVMHNAQVAYITHSALPRGAHPTARHRHTIRNNRSKWCDVPHIHTAEAHA